MPQVKLVLGSPTKSKFVQIKNKTYFHVSSQNLNYTYQGIFSSFDKALKAVKYFMKSTPDWNWGPLVRENETMFKQITTFETYATSVQRGKGSRRWASFQIQGLFLDYKDLTE